MKRRGGHLSTTPLAAGGGGGMHHVYSPRAVEGPTLGSAAVGVGCVDTGVGGAERAGHGHAARAVRGAWGATDGAEVAPQRARPLLPMRDRSDALQEDRPIGRAQGCAPDLDPRDVATPRGETPPCGGHPRLELRGIPPLETDGRAAAQPLCQQRTLRRPAAARPRRRVPPRSPRPAARRARGTRGPAGRGPNQWPRPWTRQKKNGGRRAHARDAPSCLLGLSPQPASLPCRVPTTAAAAPDAVPRRRPGAAPNARTARGGHTRRTATGRRGRRQRPSRAAAPRCGGAPTVEAAPVAAAAAAATAAPAAPTHPWPAACDGTGRQPHPPGPTPTPPATPTHTHSPPQTRGASGSTDCRWWPPRRTTPRARRHPR